MKFIIIYLLFFCDIVLCFFDPISLGAGIASGAAVGVYYFKESVIKYTYCKAVECCNDDHIPANFQKLEEDLNTKLYGQHLAKQVVLTALKAHFNEKQPQKALTLSFHGWAGSGKNYVTNFIKDALYKQSGGSKFVHHFTARVHFPVDQNVGKYQTELQNWIIGNVSRCERSLFIFDEVDKMPENVLNSIKPMIDYIDLVDKVDFRKSVFIFLSNTGGTVIKDHILNLWERGVKRNDIQLHDFETIIAKGAFNEKGGFHHSDTIKSNLIDHYIPFFPMEKDHVKLCIKDQFEIRGIMNPSEGHINEVLEFVEWGPEPINIFSSTGCKRISQKVPLIIQKNRLRPAN